MAVRGIGRLVAAVALPALLMVHKAALPDGGGGSGETFSVRDLVKLVDTLSQQASGRIKEIELRGGEAISIADMFYMQMDMDHLAQLSELSTSIVTATNTAILSMARNVK